MKKSYKFETGDYNRTLPVEFNIMNHQFFPGRAAWQHETGAVNKKSEDSLMSVKGNLQLGLPGEFEQRVFSALIMLMKKNKYEREFYVSMVEILSVLEEKNKRYYPRIKTSLKILSETFYSLKNGFYSYNTRGILEEELTFALLNVQSITRTDVISDSIKQFADGRIKEVYKITFAKEIHKNIVSAGYLAVSLEKLNNPDYSTKNLYLYLERVRNEIKLIREAFKSNNREAID